jgi:hypothetical protein
MHPSEVTDCYLNNPVRLEALEALGESINNFWMSRATLPPRAQCAAL